MLRILTYVRRFLRYLKHSIAFVPALYVLGFIGLAIGMRLLEEYGLSNWLGGDKERFFLVKDEDTARTILSTIIGGLISLTVFSFSMVMVVLSQATSTLSPRLLPQLIRDRSHQTVLGIYLGVIVFAYLILIAVVTDEAGRLPSFTIFVAVILAIICLGFFVYFISSISQRIQVGDVILNVHRRAKRNITYWSELPDGFEERTPPHFLDSWITLKAVRSGYVDVTVYEQLSKLANEYETELYLCGERRAYVLKGTPLLRVKPGLPEKHREALIDKVSLSQDSIDEFWYPTAIRHILEVAVKAMSPGINDPGTAIKSIDLLTDLMAEVKQLPRINYYCHRSGGGAVYFAETDFASLLRLIMQQLRRYCREDVVLMMQLLGFLYHLRQGSPRTSSEEAVLEDELAALRDDAKKHLLNPADHRAFVDHMSKMARGYNQTVSPG